MIFTRWQPRLRARPERKVQKVPKMPEAQRQPRLQVRQRVQLQQNNYHAGRKKAEHVTRIVSCSVCAVYDPPFAGTRSFAAQTPLGGGN